MHSASLQRPCALGQTVTCCGGMSHTTTKSLVFHREPGTVSILIPPGLAGSVPSPCDRWGSQGCRTSVFTLHCSPFPPLISFSSLVRKERFRLPCDLFFRISFLFFFWSVHLFLKAVALCFASIASIPAVQLINLPLMRVIQVSHNILLGSPVRSLCRNLYSFLVFLVKLCITVLGDVSFGIHGPLHPVFLPLNEV